MRFLNALEQARFHIRTLWVVIVLLVLLNGLLVIGWYHSQSHIRINIPPRILASGLQVTEGEVPKSTVYAFSYYIWQQLNHWSANGLKDYKANIQQLSPFLTPSFKVKLINDYNHLLNQGELQDRLRSLQGIAGSRYSVEDVQYKGHGTWWVALKMRLTEQMNMNAKTVKDVQMQYILRVVTYDVDAKENPWGLALDGFVTSPTRLKTIT